MWSSRKTRLAVIRSAMLALVAGLVALSCAQATPTPSAAKSAPAPAAPAAKAVKAEWKFASVIPAGQEYIDLFKELGTSIDKATDGQVKVTVYPAGELPYKGGDHLRVVRDGLLEMAEISTPFVVGDSPLIALTDLPYVALNDKEQDLYDKAIQPYIRKELERWSGVFIAEAPYGRRQIVAKTPVKDLASLKGLKIRAAGGLEPDLLKAMGATPTTIVWAEVYPAAQRGVIDGVMTATLAIEQAKVYEVAPYFLRTEAHRAYVNIIVGKNAWNALPADLQQKVLAAGQQWEQKWKQLVLVDWEKAAIDRMVKSGQIKQVVDLPQKEAAQLRAEMLPIIKSYVEKQAGATGQEALSKGLAALGLK